MKVKSFLPRDMCELFLIAKPPVRWKIKCGIESGFSVWANKIEMNASYETA